MFYLTIEDVASWTGLTTRSVRNYIRDGFLQGDKSSGKWQFSFDQYIAFTEHPNVAAAIATKKKSYINDFIESEPSDYNRICIILDVIDHIRETLSFFVHYIEDLDIYTDDTILFTMGPLKKTEGSRIILKGPY